jgi:hypothetical protein
MGPIIITIGVLVPLLFVVSFVVVLWRVVFLRRRQRTNTYVLKLVPVTLPITEAVVQRHPGLDQRAVEPLPTYEQAANEGLAHTLDPEPANEYKRSP